MQLIHIFVLFVVLHVASSTSPTDPMCPTFLIGDGIGGTYTREANMPPEKCIQHCKQKRNTYRNINGVTVDTAGYYCYCRYSMTARNTNSGYKTCRLETDSDPTCPGFALGDGTGGTYTREANMSPDKCIQNCMKKRKTNRNINGVTVDVAGYYCYCRSGMIARNTNTGYKTCKLESGHWKLQARNVCFFAKDALNGQAMRLWYGGNLYKRKNHGMACANVYAWFADN